MILLDVVLSTDVPSSASGQKEWPTAKKQEFYSILYFQFDKIARLFYKLPAGFFCEALGICNYGNNK